MNKVYSHLKVFRYKDKVDSLPINEGVTAPIHIRLKPTNACNCYCTYCCYRSHFDTQIGSDISYADYIPKEKMIEIISDMNDMGVKAVTFSGGGEPLCYKYIDETISKLSYTNIKFAFLTNGIMLKDVPADLIAKNASWIRISIDGWDAKSYAKYRGVSENMYDSVIENIKRFNIIKQKCRCSISLIIDQENHAHIYEMIRRFKDLGIDSVKASGVIVDDDVSKNNEYHKPIYWEVKRQIDHAIKDLTGDKFEIFDSYHELSGTYEKKYTWCPMCQVLTVIAADCNVYSCQDKAYNKSGIIGSIKNQSFKQMWNNKEQFFRINPATDCKHHCVQNYKNANIIEYPEETYRY